MFEIDISFFDNEKHRCQVIDLWRDVFDPKETHNNPSITIDKKLDQKDDLFFVALDQKKIVGTIMAGYDGHRGWIYSLAVIPERRQEKIGSKLLKYAENELRKLGCLKINLQIFSENDIVTSFYLKNGYEIEDRISMGKKVYL